MFVSTFEVADLSSAAGTSSVRSLQKDHVFDVCCFSCGHRKRYEKAEAEYVTAKLDLHRKTELKEQLTEHLCAIIQQNELRKAHKLEELMQQLQLEATEEEEEGRRRNCAQRSGKDGQDAVEGGAPPAEEEEVMKEGGEQKLLENCGEAEPVSS